MPDIVIVELGTSVATALAGRLLVDVGATVVKVEPPDGWALREDQPGYAAFLLAGKLSVTGGDGLRGRLPASVDAVLVDDDVPWPAELLDELRDDRPDLVVVTVSDEGEHRPARTATEFTLQAASGVTAVRDVLPGCPPVVSGVDMIELTSGMYAAGGLLAAVMGRGGDDLLQVDVSRFETGVSILNAPWLAAQIPGHPPYSVPLRVVPGIVPASDGWVCMVTVTDPQWQALIAMTGLESLRADRFGDIRTRTAQAAEIAGLVTDFARDRAVDELCTLGARFRVPVTPVGTAATVHELAPFAERHRYVDVGNGRWPKSPFVIDGATPVIGEIPSVGRDDGTASAVTSACGSRPLAPTGLPLAGLRVVEFGTFQAGPIVTRRLAELGADVVKVESVGRPDLIRFSGAKASDARFWEKSSPFALANLGKRDVTVDLATAAGLEVFERLVSRSDVLLDNFVPRVLEGFGYTPDALHRLNADLLVVRMPAWGTTGSWRDRPGFTYTADATSGMSDLTGFPDDPPLTTGTVIDPISAALTTVIVLARLADRSERRAGGIVEVALCDAGALLTAAAVAACSTDDRPVTRRGNDDPRHTPQGHHRTADGEWLALSVRSDDDWQRLTATSPFTELKSLGGVDDVAGRRARAAEVAVALSGVAARHTSAALLNALAQAGVPGAVLATGTDALRHPAVTARDRVFRLGHEVMGTVSWLGSPARMSYAPVVAEGFRPAPLFGEHNREVLAELGYDPQQVQALYDAGVVGELPFAPRPA